MKLGIIIFSNDSETVWNAFRLGVYSRRESDEVKVFLLGKGVECETLDTERFRVSEQIKNFSDNGGKIYTCGSCLKMRKAEGSELCPISTMRDLYQIIEESDKVITF